MDEQTKLSDYDLEELNKNDFLKITPLGNASYTITITPKNKQARSFYAVEQDGALLIYALMGGFSLFFPLDLIYLNSFGLAAIIFIILFKMLDYKKDADVINNLLSDASDIDCFTREPEPTFSML